MEGQVVLREVAHGLLALGDHPVVPRALVPGLVPALPGVVEAAGALRVEAGRLEREGQHAAAVGAARVGLREHGAASGQLDGLLVAEAADARQRAEVVVERAVLLHEDHHVLHVADGVREPAAGGGGRGGGARGAGAGAGSRGDAGQDRGGAAQQDGSAADAGADGAAVRARGVERGRGVDAGLEVDVRGVLFGLGGAHGGGPSSWIVPIPVDGGSRGTATRRARSDAGSRGDARSARRGGSRRVAPGSVDARRDPPRRRGTARRAERHPAECLLNRGIVPPRRRGSVRRARPAGTGR
ncbi:hypothetical protein ACAD29_00451 [Clavibacter nebraskensis]